MPSHVGKYDLINDLLFISYLFCLRTPFKKKPHPDLEDHNHSTRPRSCAVVLPCLCRITAAGSLRSIANHVMCCVCVSTQTSVRVCLFTAYMIFAGGDDVCLDVCACVGPCDLRYCK